MSSKIIYLHIGAPKTGSTSIQKFLSTNEELLAKNDIFIPKHGRVLDAANFARFVCAFRPFHSDKAIHFKTSEDADKYLSVLKNEIQTTSCTNVILSAENLYFLDDKEVDQVIDFFSDHELRVVVYIRTPQDWVASLYNQQVKVGLTKMSFDDYYDKFRKNLVQTSVFSFVKKLGEERVIVRPFGKTLLYKNIYEDFTRFVFGLDFTDEYVQPESENLSLNFDALEFMRRINTSIAGDSLFNNFSTLLIKHYEKIEFQPNPYHLTKDQASAIDDDFKERHKVLYAMIAKQNKLDSFTSEDFRAIVLKDKNTFNVDNILILFNFFLKNYENLFDKNRDKVLDHLAAAVTSLSDA